MTSTRSPAAEATPGSRARGGIIRGRVVVAGAFVVHFVAYGARNAEGARARLPHASADATRPDRHRGPAFLKSRCP